MRRVFGRTQWNFTPFRPDRLKDLVVREARVMYFPLREEFELNINVEGSLRNEWLNAFLLSRRLDVRFEGETGRFYLKRCSVMESTITIVLAGGPNREAQFKTGKPILLQSRRVVESRLLLSPYVYSVCPVVPKPPPPDPDDIPF